MLISLCQNPRYSFASSCNFLPASRKARPARPRVWHIPGALDLELVAVVLAGRRNAGEARERARLGQAEPHDRLQLVDIDPRDAAAVPARRDRRFDADVDRSPDFGGGRRGGRALARRRFGLRFRKPLGDAVETAGRARGAVLGGRCLGSRLGLCFLRRRRLFRRCRLGLRDLLGCWRGRRPHHRFEQRRRGHRLGRCDIDIILFAEPCGGGRLADHRRGRLHRAFGDQVDFHRGIVEPAFARGPLDREQADDDDMRRHRDGDAASFIPPYCPLFGHRLNLGLCF